MIVVGKIGAPYGVKGWVHVQSFTDKAETILSFAGWKVKINQKHDWQDYKVMLIKPHGTNFVAHLAGVQDRDNAALLTNAEIAVPRSGLPSLELEDEYYWADLIGLQVINLQGKVLGQVSGMLDTGANDVLVIEQGSAEILVPFVLQQYVLSVDLSKKIIQVDWQDEEE